MLAEEEFDACGGGKKIGTGMIIKGYDGTRGTSHDQPQPYCNHLHLRITLLTLTS